MRKIKKTIAALTCFGLAFAGAGVCNVATTQTASADTTATFECAGASIRLDYNKEDGIQTGIRFRVKIDNATLEAAGEANIKILVMPTDLLGDGVLDVNDTDAREETLDDWRNFVNDDGSTDENYKQAYAYTYGMTEAEWNRPTTWRAYYLDENGEPVYSNQTERSLSEVALCLENDETETPERKAMADDYILDYTYTYDHGVRDTNGEWKKTTYTFRYGDELSTEAATAPTLETREDFEFLAWETTKGADKVKTVNETSIVTGNVVKEAYWLLTGEISLDSPEKVAEYADLTQAMPRTAVVENPTSTGVAFVSGQEASTNIEYAHISWKNIVVNTNLNCRFKGYVTSAKRASDNAMGKTKAYFETGETDQQVYNIQNAEFDEFRTQDISTFASYRNESGYYELADFVLQGSNAVHVAQTTTFEKFQIGATQVIDTALSGNNTYANDSWAWLGNAKDGFNLLPSSTYSDIKATVSDSYFACTATRAKQSGTQFFRIMLPNASLKAGDKIVVKMKAVGATFMGIESNGANNGSLLVNGGELNYVNATTTEKSVKTGESFGTAVYTVANDISKYWLIFGAAYGQTADVVIESIEVQASAITTDVPQFMSGANEGAQSVTLDNEGTVNQGVITGADNVKYAFVGTSAWGKDALTFNFKNITLNAGDKIYLKAVGTTAADIKVNGTSANTALTAGETYDGAVFTATEEMTLQTLSFAIAAGEYESVDFTVYQLYIVRAA